MKIIDSWVDDPAHHGFHNQPSLHVKVDSEPQLSGEESITLEDGNASYWVEHYGPFVRFTFFYTDQRRNTGALGGGWSSRAGVYNVHVVPDKQLVDVTLWTPKYPNVGLAGYSLELDRVRAVMHRYCSGWVIRPSAQGAALGDIQWSPAERSPSCLWKPSGQIIGNDPICGAPATQPFMNRELGICDEHAAVRDHKALQRRLGHKR